MMRTAVTLPIGLVAIAAIAAGCARTPKPDVLEIGYSALRISLPLFVAKDRGLFERRGLNVRLKRYETAQPLVEEVLDGRILAGGYAALPIIFTAASQDGSQVRLAGAMVEDRTHPVSYLLRRKGDTKLASVSGLDGKNIGILPTVAYRRWLEALLSSAGVPLSRVTISPLAPSLQAGVLDGGGVDALFTNDPVATAAIQTGVAERIGEAAPVPRALGGQLLFGSFLIHPKLVGTRPDVAEQLIGALDEAIALVHADQAGARRAMGPFVRAPERLHAGHYPPARYLPSTELTSAAIGAEVAAQVKLAILPRPIDTKGWVITTRPP